MLKLNSPAIYLWSAVMLMQSAFCALLRWRRMESSYPAFCAYEQETIRIHEQRKASDAELRQQIVREG